MPDKMVFLKNAADHKALIDQLELLDETVYKAAVLIAGTTPLGTDTLAIQVFWNDTINAVFAPTARLNTNYLPVTSTTLGTEDTSFNTSIIPPGVWVFCKSTAGTTGRKPKALYVTLYGFKRNRSY